MVHLRHTHTILLCPDTVLLMHGLTMHAGGHNQGIGNNSLWVFAWVQVSAHEAFQPQCPSLTRGTFYTNESMPCDWHMCTECRGDRGIEVDTQMLLESNDWHIRDLWVHGWVILKVLGLAASAGGSYTAQAIFIDHLWHTLQDPILGDEDGCQILQLDDTVGHSILHNCMVVWKGHLEGMRKWIATGLGMELDMVHFYELSLLQNVAPVENQSLHRDCPFPPESQEEEDLGDQEELEEGGDEGDSDSGYS